MMMKKTLLFYTLLMFSFGISQQKIATDYLAMYFVEYKFHKKKTKAELLLFMNAKTGESYFISTSNYLLQKALAKNEESEEVLMKKYNSFFNEKVYNKNQKLTVYQQIVNANLKYNENPQIKWTITNETKMHGGVKVTKAYANAFGRKWYAWFSDNPLHFAPYKFVGLPGLVLVMKDAKGDFFIQLTNLKKKAYTTKLPNPKKYKQIKKSKIEQVKYNQHVVRISQLVLFDNPTEKRQYKKRLEKVYHLYPRLDIDFPYQP